MRRSYLDSVIPVPLYCELVDGVGTDGYSVMDVLLSRTVSYGTASTILGCQIVYHFDVEHAEKCIFACRLLRDTDGRTTAEARAKAIELFFRGIHQSRAATILAHRERFVEMLDRMMPADPPAEPPKPAKKRNRRKK